MTDDSIVHHEFEIVTAVSVGVYRHKIHRCRRIRGDEHCEKYEGQEADSESKTRQSDHGDTLLPANLSRIDLLEG